MDYFKIVIPLADRSLFGRKWVAEEALGGVPKKRG